MPASPRSLPSQRSARPRPGRKALQLSVEFMRALATLWLRFPRLNPPQRLDEIERWSQRVLKVLGIEVRCAAAPRARRAVLIVANHLSWLDILVIQSLLPGSFVAKGEVRRWPLIGAMARTCQTIFVERDSPRSAHAMVDAAAAALAQGHPVIAFPEGTSSTGQQVGPLHANIFEAAIRAGTPVQPLVLRYTDARTGLACDAVPYVGDMSLAASLRKVLAAGPIRAHVSVGADLDPARHNRRSLARQVHFCLQEQLARGLQGGRD